MVVSLFSRSFSYRLNKLSSSLGGFFSLAVMLCLLCAFTLARYVRFNVSYIPAYWIKHNLFTMNHAALVDGLDHTAGVQHLNSSSCVASSNTNLARKTRIPTSHTDMFVTLRPHPEDTTEESSIIPLWKKRRRRPFVSPFPARRLSVPRAELAAASTVRPAYIIFAGGGSPKQDAGAKFVTTTKRNASVVHRIPPDGGPDRGGGGAGAADILRLSDGVWLCQKLSSPRRSLVAASAISHAYFAGGELKGAPSDTVDVFDAVAGKFDTPLRMSHPRNFHCIAVSLRFESGEASARVYFGGGTNANRGRGGGLSANVDVLDDSTLTWLNHRGGAKISAQPPLRLSAARKKLACTASGGLVMFAGGVMQAAGPTDVVDVYDESQGKFIKPLRLPSGRRGYLSAASTEKFIVFAGGQRPCPRGTDCGPVSGDRHPGLDVYDVVERRWISGLGDLLEARSSPTALGVDARLLGWPNGTGFTLFAGGNAQASAHEIMQSLPGACEGVIDTCKRNCRLGEPKSGFMLRRGFTPHMDGTRALYKRSVANERDREQNFPKWCASARAAHSDLWQKHGVRDGSKSSRHFDAPNSASMTMHAKAVLSTSIKGNCTGHLCQMWRSPAVDIVHAFGESGSAIGVAHGRMALARFGFAGAAAPLMSDDGNVVEAVVVALAGGRWRRRWWPWPSEVDIDHVDYIYISKKSFEATSGSTPTHLAGINVDVAVSRLSSDDHER